MSVPFQPRVMMPGAQQQVPNPFRVSGGTLPNQQFSPEFSGQYTRPVRVKQAQSSPAKPEIKEWTPNIQANQGASNEPKPVVVGEKPPVIRGGGGTRNRTNLGDLDQSLEASPPPRQSMTRTAPSLKEPSREVQRERSREVSLPREQPRENHFRSDPRSSTQRRRGNSESYSNISLMKSQKSVKEVEQFVVSNNDPDNQSYLNQRDPIDFQSPTGSRGSKHFVHDHLFMKKRESHQPSESPAEAVKPEFRPLPVVENVDRISYTDRRERAKRSERERVEPNERFERAESPERHAKRPERVDRPKSPERVKRVYSRESDVSYTAVSQEKRDYYQPEQIIETTQEGVDDGGQFEVPELHAAETFGTEEQPLEEVQLIERVEMARRVEQAQRMELSQREQQRIRMQHIQDTKRHTTKLKHQEPPIEEPNDVSGYSDTHTARSARSKALKNLKQRKEKDKQWQEPSMDSPRRFLRQYTAPSSKIKPYAKTKTKAPAPYTSPYGQHHSATMKAPKRSKQPNLYISGGLVDRRQTEYPNKKQSATIQVSPMRTQTAKATAAKNLITKNIIAPKPKPILNNSISRDEEQSYRAEQAFAESRHEPSLETTKAKPSKNFFNAILTAKKKQTSESGSSLNRTQIRPQSDHQVYFQGLPEQTSMTLAQRRQQLVEEEKTKQQEIEEIKRLKESIRHLEAKRQKEYAEYLQMKKEYEQRVEVDRIEREKLLKLQEELARKPHMIEPPVLLAPEITKKEESVAGKISEEVEEFNSMAEPELPERKLEFVVEIQMKDKGFQEIRVFEGDTPEELAQAFCKNHQVGDHKKQSKLLKLIEQRMTEHYGENLQELREADAFLQERWVDFNPKAGIIDLPTFLDLMKYCGSQKGAKQPREAAHAFSKERLEQLFASRKEGGVLPHARLATMLVSELRYAKALRDARKQKLHARRQEVEELRSETMNSVAHDE